ncbi:MAG: RNA polymerase sigma factor [Candidatus Omnitrophota bacterium]
METELLLKRCINKNRNAWKEFTRLYTALIRKSVVYKLRNLGVFLPKIDMDDIVQEILLSIWEKDKLSRIKDIKSLQAWLVMISINMTLNYCRKHVFRHAKDLESLDAYISDNDEARSTLKDFLSGNTVPAGETASFNELCQVINSIISGLKARDQLVIKLNIYDGAKQKDIAKIMNLPISTVGTVLSRAKKELKRQLEIKWDF